MAGLENLTLEETCAELASEYVGTAPETSENKRTAARSADKTDFVVFFIFLNLIYFYTILSFFDMENPDPLSNY
jgi:hypothetical protein